MEPRGHKRDRHGYAPASRVGRYRLDRRIAFGGSAEVWLAHDDSLGGEVVVKALRADLAEDLDARTRFVREARLMRRLNDPHLLRLHELGQADDGRPFIVIDHVNGGSLADRQRPADVIEEAVDALESALSTMHANGLVHRDLSPSNLLVAVQEDGSSHVMVADLGFAYDGRAETEHVTAVGGTVRYAAPEQLDVGERITDRADVYGATAVLWWIVTDSEPPLVHELEARLPAAPWAWRRLLRTGLAPDPAARPAGIREWAARARACMVNERAASASGTLEGNPYQPATSLSFERGDIAYGRGAIVERIVDQLRANRSALVGGASGVGKSSILRAGLAASVAAGPVAGCSRLVVVTPDEELPPIESLDDAIVVIDQFERTLIGATRASEAEPMVPRLIEAGVPVVVGLRSDFYPEAAQHPSLAELLDRHVLVAPLRGEGLRDAVEGPAARRGVMVEARLVQRAVDDCGSHHGGLPLLAFTLAEAWNARTGQTFTLADYEAVGGMERSVANVASRFEAGLSENELRVLRRILLRLVSIPERTGPAVACPLRHEHLDDEHASMANRLVENRLCIATGTGLELSHEALLDAWPTLRRWTARFRDALEARTELDLAAQRWADSKERPSLLLRSDELVSLEHRLDPLAADLSPQSDHFLARCRAERRRIANRRRALLAGVVVLGVLATISTLVALAGQRRVEASLDAQTEAIENQVALRLAALVADDGLALPVRRLLAAEAIQRAPNDARIVAAAARAVDPPVGTLVAEVGLPARGLEVGWNPDGQEVRAVHSGGLLVAGVDGTILDRLPVDDTITVVASDPQHVAFVAGDSTVVHRWDDLAAGPVAELAERSTAVEIASEPWLIVAAHPGGRIVLSDDSGRIDGPALGATVHTLALSPDRTTIAIGSNDGLSMWYRDSGEIRTVIDDERVWDATWSPDGRQLAVGTAAGVAIVSTEIDGATVRGLVDCACSIWAVEFSPDGTAVASAGSDGSARVVEAATGRELLRQSHGREAVHVTFDRTGTRLASSGKDDVTVLTHVGTRGRLGQIEHRDWVWRSAFAPGEPLIATIGSDDTLRISTASADAEVILDDHGPIPTLIRSGTDVTLALRPDGTLFAVDHLESEGVAVAENVQWFETTASARRAVLLGADGSVHLAEAPSHGTEWTVSRSDHPAAELAAVDGTSIATAAGSVVTITTDDRSSRSVELAAPATHLVFASDSDLVVATEDGRAMTVPADMQLQLEELLAGTGEPPTDVEVSPDGAMIAVASGTGAVRVVDRSSGIVGTVASDATRPALAFSEHDSAAILLIADRATAHIAAIRLDDGVALWETNFGDAVHEVVSLPDLGLIVVSGVTGHSGVGLIDVADGALLAELFPTSTHATDGRARSIAVDGRLMVGVDIDESVTRRVMPTAYLDRLCALRPAAPTDLSPWIPADTRYPPACG